MKTLMDHVQEFAFDTTNDVLKRFTPEQAAELQTRIKNNSVVDVAISNLQKVVITDVVLPLLEDICYSSWDGDDNINDN